jgi:ribosomal protein S18 acetylase RimI-like enzyme
MEITYRQLARAEINKFTDIDRTETIRAIYRQSSGELLRENRHIEVPDWTEQDKQRYIANIEASYDTGATIFGAFFGGKLAGMSVLEHQPVKTGKNRLNLAGLWVSSPYRKMGVGKTLFHLAAQEAQRRGAKSLYVSATESENTIHFYQKQGCVPATPVDPDLFEKEPEDIHLELILIQE